MLKWHDTCHNESTLCSIFYKLRWKSAGDHLDDDGESAFFVFGGDNAETSSPANGTYLNDLWALDLASSKKNDWKLLQQKNPPAGRRGHTFQFTEDHKMLVFGGKSTHKCLNDLKYTDAHAALYGLRNSSYVIEWYKGMKFPGECRWGHTANIMRDR